jgi:primosomal replication protein N
MNRVLLQAQVIERGMVRYTPAGLPALDCVLKHESTTVEAGHPRKISLEIRAVGLGDVGSALGKLEIGCLATFEGFLGSARNGKGVLLHLTGFQIDQAQAIKD